MKIISISRMPTNVDMPSTFVLGTEPITPNGVVGPPVKNIKYFATSTVYDKIYRDSVYIVEFEDSTVRRVIPASKVVDIAVETAKEVAQALPELPE